MRLIESGAFSAILLGLLPEEWQKCTCVQGIIVDAEIYCAGYFIHGLDIKHLIDKGRPASVLEEGIHANRGVDDEGAGLDGADPRRGGESSSEPGLNGFGRAAAMTGRNS